jgi:protein SCO1
MNSTRALARFGAGLFAEEQIFQLDQRRKAGMALKMRLVLSVVFCMAVLLPCICQASSYERRFQRTVETYTVPNVVLINQNGEKVNLKKLLETDKPVILDFIFGTCTTICPVLSVGFVNLQHKLGPEAGNVRFVSISIDPEHDTPEVMKNYLKRYRGGPGWDFLSGSRQDIERVMKAFNAYVANKMDHLPLNLIRSPADGRWIRLYGLMSSTDFMNEYRQAARQ